MPFKKGQSGNPKGRLPGSFSLVDLMRRELANKPEGNSKTYGELMIKKILHKAIIEGDHNSQKLVANYIEGMPKQAVDMTTGGESLNQPMPTDIDIDELAKRMAAELRVKKTQQPKP